VGQLNRPRFPDIEGRDSFAGPAFHSAEWRHDVDLKGKRVAVIGTGASSYQFVPEIAPDVAHLTVFQRNPPWGLPVPHYHEDVPEGMKWTLEHVPYYDKWYRFQLFWMTTEGFLPMVKADPTGTARRPPWGRRTRACARWRPRRSPPGRRPARPARQGDPAVPDRRQAGGADNGVWLGALKRATSASSPTRW
jgi:4-hydroxyacetophenone monooxygenase